MNSSTHAVRFIERTDGFANHGSRAGEAPSTRRLDRAMMLKLVGELVASDAFRPSDFLLAGSARLLLEGIVDHIHDIDIVARGASFAYAFTRAEAEGGLVAGAVTGDKLAQLCDGTICVSERWVGGEDTDALIDDADVIGGMRFLSIGDVAGYKRRLNRPKDRQVLEDLKRLGY